MRKTGTRLMLCVAAMLCAAPAASAEEPKLTVSESRLRAGLKCTEGLKNATRTPVMLVTGTGASGDEAYAIGKDALTAYGAPVCWVNFPNHTTADLQISVQYLVYGLRTMARRADRQVAVLGVSQGAILPRVALTYWPSLRSKVSDVIGAAGAHHGTTSARLKQCAGDGCVPAAWQQATGSAFLRALNARRDETPGPTAWTTVRSSSDEVVRPHPTSKLKGASNVLIQDVCPGREVSHIGTILDSVTFELAIDAIARKGPGRVSRLPGDVCSHPYAKGLDEAQTKALIDGAGGLTQGRYESEPKVKREPTLRAWVKRRV